MFLSRAKAFLHSKQFEGALADLAEALRLNPQAGEALMVRAAVRVEMGEFSQALADVEQRLRLQPPDPLALLLRGNLRACLGDIEPALADFTEFLAQQPASVPALQSRALNYARLQRFDEALADLNEALRLEPASARTCLERGRVYQNMGRYQSALADYQQALDLEPEDAYVHNQYAWMLAACPQPEYRDGPRAVALARRGCELTNWQDANIFDTLASAYAECGQFDEALTWANKAMEMANDEIKEAVAEHVKLFRQKLPARIEIPSERR
jgi:tetratricopeptide (TPR) repeat protein